MTELRQAAEMVLKALEEINKLSVGENAICLPAEIDGAMEALRQALAIEEQISLEYCDRCGWRAIAPPDGCLICDKKKWVGLSDEEGAEIWADAHDIDRNRLVTPKEIVRRIEAKLKEKNGG